MKIILKTINHGSKNSTYAILGGDIPYRPGVAGALERTLTRKTKETISDSDFFVIYFNNLSKKQLGDIDANLVNYNHYLGYVYVNQDSLFKRVLAGCLPQICIVSKDRAIVESSPESSSETCNPFCDLLGEYYKVAIVNELGYGTFLTHAIASVFPDTKNISLHVNAIYPQPVDYSSDNIIVTQDKIDYLKKDNGKHRKWSAIFGTTEYGIDSFKKLICGHDSKIVYNVVIKGPDQLHPKVILFDVIGGIIGPDGVYYNFTLGFRLLIGGHNIELVTAY